MGIISAKLHHVGLVVRDLKAIASGYAELLGLDTWNVTELAGLTRDARVRGMATDIEGPVAVGSAPWGDVFWLIEPGAGRSTYKDFQATNGHGVHHLAFELDHGDVGPCVERFGKLGAGVIQEYDVAGAGRVTEVDTRSLLGGYYVQLLSSPTGEPVTLPRGDKLELAGTYERPDGLGPLPVPRGIQHFGVVVRNMADRLDAYTEVFGVPDWTVQNWRTEAGSLENPTFEGRPVDHEYFAATTPFEGDLGFEVVQPTLGPSDYRENFLNRVGEGIHHLNLVGFENHAAWLRMHEWLELAGVRVCMSGTLTGGIAEFYYLDTRRRLGGIAVECFGMDPDADLSKVRPRGPYYRFKTGYAPALSKPSPPALDAR